MQIKFIWLILFFVALQGCAVMKAKVAFVTQPEGAHVYLNGQYIGETPIITEVLFTDKEKNTVIFVKEGYEKEVIKFNFEDVKKDKKIFVVLKKAKSKIVPRLEMKYLPEERRILYSIELEKAYEQTIETSPNVSQVEMVIFERLPIIIGKIDVYKDKIVYEKKYPIVSSSNKDKVLDLHSMVLHIQELKNIVISLEKMLQFPKQYKIYKEEIKKAVFLREEYNQLFSNLNYLMAKINSPADVLRFSKDIKRIIEHISYTLEKIKTLDVKRFSSEIWMTNVSSPQKVRVTYSGKKWVDCSPALFENFVYFASNRGNMRDFDIWRVNLDRASGLMKIVNFPYSQEFSPCIDNTGNLIVFESLPLDAMEKQIWTIRSDGTLPSQLKIGSEPDIFEDKIVFVRQGEKGRKQIWIMNIDGSGETVLTDDTYNSFSPKFSPDGKWIVYVSDEAGNKDIWIMKIDGSTKIQLTTNPSADLYPAWNTDGYIYFVSNRGLMWGIWRLKPIIKE